MEYFVIVILVALSSTVFGGASALLFRRSTSRYVRFMIITLTLVLHSIIWADILGRIFESTEKSGEYVSLLYLCLISAAPAFLVILLRLRND